MEREIRKKKITWRLNNMLQNKWEVNNEIKEEIKKYTETNDKKTQSYKFLGMQQKQSYKGSSQ